MRHARGAAAGFVLGLGSIVGAMSMPDGAAASEPETAFKRLVIAQSPVRWLPRSNERRLVLSYAIADRDLNDPEAINCGAIRAPAALLANSHIGMAILQVALVEALQRWESVADIAFEPAASVETADIVVGEQARPVGRAYTNVSLAKTLDTTREGSVRAIVRAAVCLNPEQPWKVGFDGDLAVYDLVHTLTHEIGHAIGLDHPAGRGNVMSFRYDESHAGLSGGDALGAVALYGPRPQLPHTIVDANGERIAPSRTSVPAGSTELGIR